MIIKRRLTRNFTTIPNELWHDKRLSVEAKGLQGFLLSLPHDWEINISHLSKWGEWGRDKTRRIVGELVDSGWIIRERIRAEDSKQFTGTHYIVRDEPSETATSCEPRPENTVLGEPRPENPGPGKPAPENQPLQKKDSLEKKNIQNARAGASELIKLAPGTHDAQIAAWEYHYEEKNKSFHLKVLKQQLSRDKFCYVKTEWPPGHYAESSKQHAEAV